MLRRRGVAGLLVAVALLAAGGAWLWSRAGGGMPADPTALRPDDAAVVAVGQRIYTQHCASCHGADLRGQPDWRQRGPDGLLPAPPHDASGHTWHHPDAVLFAITQRGVAQVAGMPDYRSAMPIYGGQLRDDEIVAVLSFIKSRWPADIRARHDEVNAAARANAAAASAR